MVHDCSNRPACVSHDDTTEPAQTSAILQNGSAGIRSDLAPSSRSEARLARTRTIISILLDIGRLIDQGYAFWLAAAGQVTRTA